MLIMETSIVILTLGVILLLGFSGVFVFEKTGLPDILFLITIGLVVGPVFHLVDVTPFRSITSVFESLALIIILFYGGIELDYHLIKERLFPTVILFSLTFIPGFFLIYLTFKIFKYTSFDALMFASAVSCISSAVIISIMKGMKVSDEIKTQLVIESTISDIVCIIIALFLIRTYNTEGTGFLNITGSFSYNLFTPILAALVVGFLWLMALDKLKGKDYLYMLSLGIVLILYSVFEIIGSNGALFVISFGIVLSNEDHLFKFLNISREKIIDANFITMHREITFLVKTFFFVYIGIIFTPSILTIRGVLIILLTMIILVFTRWGTVTIYAKLISCSENDRRALIFSIPRGLATAVIAGLPKIYNIPVADEIVDISLIIILLTNILMTVGLVIRAKNNLSTIN